MGHGSCIGHGVIAIRRQRRSSLPRVTRRPSTRERAMCRKMHPLLWVIIGMGGCRALSVAPGAAAAAVSQPAFPTLTSKLGFSFTPGGLLFPYYLGVAKSLETEGYLAVDTPLAGSSAGALAAAVVGCGLEMDSANQLAGNVFEECRDGGAAFRLKEIVRRGLENSLPDDAHDIINNREGPVTVGITQLFPRPKGVFVSEFNSRADLIEVLLGSCHVPFWFSPRPYMSVRGKATVDGFFSVPTSYFGSPEIPTADQVVRVTVFPTTSVDLYSEQPGDIISPDLLDRYASGQFSKLLKYALNAADEVVMKELFQAGFDSGDVWCNKYGEDYRMRHEENHSSETVASL